MTVDDLLAKAPRKRANSEEKKLEENDEDSFEVEFIQDEDDFSLYVFSDPKFYYEKGKLVAEIV